MKHTVLVLSSVLLLFATTAEARQIDGGVKGGLNFATLSGDDLDEVKSLTAAGFGGFVVYRLNDRVALQPEVLYMGKGTRGDDPEDDIRLKLGYIEVPVLLRVSLASGNGGVQPHVLIGPAVSFNTSCKFEGRDEGTSLEFDCDNPVIQEFLGDFEPKSVDFGAVVGGGVAVPMGGFNFVLDARYNLGLTEIFEDFDVKNRTFSAMAGVSIPLGRRAVAVTR